MLQVLMQAILGSRILSCEYTSMSLSQTQLTGHFSKAEACTTSTGLANVPTVAELERIQNTAENMEIVRAILGRRPIKVSSWFRSEAVNTRVGGSKTSEHRLGAAVDFTCPSFGSPYEVAKTLASYSSILNYNQLIYEQTWVHISFPPDGQLGKRENLTMKHGSYSKGINLS